MIWHTYRDQIQLFDRFFNKIVNHGEHKQKQKNETVQSISYFFTVMSNGIHIAVKKKKILTGESLISYQVFLDGLLCDRH